MKTFTTYAEKKAKQFLNLLQGYTKGIRITAILILLLMGVNNAWAYDISAGSHIYLVNTGSWSGCQLYIWKSDGYNTYYTFSKITNTNIYHYYFGSKWEGYEGVKFRSDDSWSKQSSGNINKSLSSCYFVGTGTTNYTTLANMNGAAKVVSMVSIGGNYTEQANSACIAKVSGYNLAEKASSTNEVNASTGSASNASIKAAYGSTITYTATAGTGYTFKGFSTTNSTSLPSSPSASGTTATANKYGSSANNTTYYAYFKANQYTVKFDANGGTGSMSNQSHTYDVSKALTANAFTRTGYTFAGWNTKADGTGTSYTDKQSVSNLSSTDGATVTLYAQWTAIPVNSHNITYTTQGTGWTYGASNPTSAEEGATVTFVVNPTAGYRVDVTSSDVTLTQNGNNYTFTMPNKDVAIKVSAKPEQYTVTLDNQGATTAGTTSITAIYNAAMPAITKPAKTGYTFGGYYTATNGGGTQYYKADGLSAKTWTETSVTKLYAKWTANTYTVKFNANGGTGSMSNQSFTYDEEKALTANAFTRKGYTFLGWAKSSSATTVTYTDKQKVKNLTATNNSTVNLYAVWQALPPTPVILKPNDQWKQDNARYAIYYWGDGTDNIGWVEMTDLGCSGEYFTAEVPASYLDFKFVRLDPKGKGDASKNDGLHWDYKWNETNNLTAPAADKNLYDMTVVSSSHLLFKSNSNWTADGARTAAYFFGNGEKWVSMTDIGDGIYYCEKPSGYTKVIFGRMNPGTNDNNFNDGVKWNQTGDLTLPTDGKNLYTISGDLNNLSGTWSASADNVFDNTKWTTYTVPTYTININATEGGSIAVTVGGNTTTVTTTPTQIKNIALGTTFTVAYTPNTGFELGHSEVEGIKEAYNGADTYTVCGPVDITAHFVTKEEQVVYLRPNGTWLSDNALFYAYAFNRYGDDEWIELTTKKTDYTGAFSGTIPAGYSDVIFVRLNPNGTDNSNNKLNFNNAWNQSVDYVIPVKTTTNRFIIGEKITAEGADKDKYQGSWEASDTPIYGIPGDWQNGWKADEYPLMGPDGLVTVDITQTNDTLGFKVYHYPYGSDDKSAQWLGNNGTMVRGGEGVHEGGWTMETSADNCGLAVDVAGNYVFHFNIRESKLTVQYPPMPVPSTITLSAQRVFEDAPLSWIAGNGTKANPYQLYVDEAARFTITGLADVSGLMTCYRMGDDEEQTSNIIDFTNILTKDTAYTIYAYYKNAAGATSDTVTVQTPYIKGVPMPFYLMTTPSQEINVDRIAAGENITVQFRSDAAATVGLYLQINDGDTTKLTDITNSISKDYTHYVDNNIEPCILHYIARSTATVHGRTFEAKADVAIYKNVIIKVHDPDGWVKNAYMWRDYSDAVKTQWPGEPVLQNFGTWRVFSVKYPYYDRFIVNEGLQEGGKQTLDWILPADDTCYELLDPADNGSDKEEDKGKYGLKVADCPENLLVEDIKDTTIMEGEQIVVMPKIYVGLGYKLSDVRITQLNAINPSSVRAEISSTNIIIWGYGIGESQVNVTYDLDGTEVQKTFKVTVEKNTNITIQVKVPVNFGDGNDYQWKDGTKIGIRYWGAGIDGTDLLMDYAFTNATHHYAQAQLPLGTDGKINFHFYYERHSVQNEDWRQTTNIENVTKSGCYMLKQNTNGYNRSWQHHGDYCFDDTNYAQYQVKVFLPTAGKEYSSNVVTNTTDTLSFFAPGQNETGYRAGTVQLYKNGKMVAAINPTMFAESNVYTATVNETEDGLGNVAPYSGNFYIRTWGTDGDINNMGWHSVKEWNASQKKSRSFTEFTSREGEFYNHYWVQAMNTGNEHEGKDVSACVANEYNDDLAGKLTKGKGTDEYGDIKVGKNKTINVRFGYDPRTNYFGRAIINGSEYDNYLNIHCDNAYRNKDCTPSKKFPYGLGNSGYANKMYDISNWVYQRDFYVPIDNSHPSASLYVEATSPSTTLTVTDHLLGYVINEITGEESNTPVQRTVIGSGTTNGTYLIRVVYDFKTNRLIAAWLPQGTVTVEQEMTLNADVLFVREENNEVPQIQLSNQGKIKSLESMFFAMELQRGDENAANRQVEQYWFTLPFDCKVGSISGVHGYLQIWGIQRYRGDLRAEKGWYAETPTFWEWMDIDDVMHAGEGYLLVFDKKNAPFEKIEVDKMDAEGNIIDGQKETISMMRLYFPSMTSGFDMQQQSTEQLTRTYENHTCTLTLHDRYLQDSNWKVIGTTSYNNAGITGYTVDTDPKYEELSDAPNFRYSYEYNWKNGFKYTYTPENGKTATYQSFYGYMVQFAGTISWQPIMSETVPEYIAARRYVPANERTSFTTRLEIVNAEGKKQDQAFVALDEKATTTFDQNKDLNKVINSHKANIYTLSEGIPFAGNTLPMENVTVPVGVRIATAGEYTFRMPDGTDGISVTLVDNVTGTHTDMLMDEYTITLDAGTIENRFYLVVDPDRTATSVENVGEEAKGEETKGQIKKFLIDGKLFIRTADGIFDAKGQRL